MKTVARFVTRLQGEGDGLFVGSLTQQGVGTLDPNSVYEIRDVLGQLTLVKIGEATGSNEGVIGPKRERADGIAFHWAHDISDILASRGALLFLARDELKVYQEQLNASQNI